MTNTAEGQVAEATEQDEGQADKGQIKVTETDGRALGHYHLPAAKDAAHLAIRSLQGVEGNILAGLAALEAFAQELSDWPDACDIQSESERQAGVEALESARRELQQVRGEVADWFGHVKGSENVLEFPDAELAGLESLSLRLTATKPYRYSRTTWCPTTGRTGNGAQQRRVSLIRPKRPSSWKSSRQGRSRGASFNAFATSFGSFF